MASTDSTYDEVLSSILINEKSILGFLSAIFNFLARRTDFYYVPEGPYENMGFPPGVAEELVIKVLRKCDPKSWQSTDSGTKPGDLNDEIMCSTVAQEVEVVAEEDLEENDSPESETEPDNNTNANETAKKPEIPKQNTVIVNDTKNTIAPAVLKTEVKKTMKATPNVIPDDYKPPIIPTQKNSETYNGAERENYLWSQNIMELEVTVKLPPDIISSKQLKVTINSGDICVARKDGTTIIKDTLPYKIKALDSFWSFIEGKLCIHLEKVQERWWNKFLNSEEAIDLDKIDCSRPLDELPEDHVDKVRELQWNQDRKMKGLPTSDEIRNMDVLKKAWNAPGSPFQGQKFDPSILNTSNTLPSFSGDQ